VGLTQEELAERAGLSQNAISLLERGERRNPYPHTVRLLANALGLDAEDRDALIATARRARDTPSPWSATTGLLPTATTPFIGRETEVAAAARVFQESTTRLLTFTGTGGVGKSRLALTVAASVAAGMKEPARFVSLAAVTDPSLVPAAIAEGLGLAGIGDRLEAVASALDDRELVLVLDNFEQVISAAPVVRQLLERCPRLRVIVTSRLPLRLDGEQEFPVRPLPLPSHGPTVSLDAAAQAPAVALFLQRARAARPDFALTQDNVRAVVELCHRLDGLPLAIELAASRIRVLSPAAMLNRMPERLSLLVGGGPDRPERLQTMRNAIDWSYTLLDPRSQQCFRWFSVFSGGFTLEAAEALETLATASLREAGSPTAGAGRPSAVDILSELVDHGLVHREPRLTGEVRLDMLETIRAYGHDRLVESGELEAVRRAHAAHYLSHIRDCRIRQEGPERRAAQDEVRQELDNIRAALAYLIEAGDAETAHQMAAELGLFWISLGMLDEGQMWMARVLAMQGDSRERCDALYWASIVATLRSDLKRARSLIEESLESARRIGNTLRTGMALIHLGELVGEHDPEGGEGLVRQGLALFEGTGEVFRQAIAYRQLALMAHRRGDYALARDHHNVALKMYEEIDHRWGVPISLRGLAETALAMGDLEEARERFVQSITAWRELGEPVHMSDCLLGLAQVNARIGNPERAVRLLGARSALDQRLGFVHNQTATDQILDELKATLGKETFVSTWAEGHEGDLDQVLDDELTVV
jgi:predicted ATPase/DNA-binding XRE family transcriptional regulator